MSEYFIDEYFVQQPDGSVEYRGPQIDGTYCAINPILLSDEKVFPTSSLEEFLAKEEPTHADLTSNILPFNQE